MTLNNHDSCARIVTFSSAPRHELTNAGSQTDVMLVSCDVITDVSLHLLADLHRTYDATVTMLLSPAIDITDVSVPGGKANRKMERDIVGLDSTGNRLLFLSSEADIEEEVIPVKRRFLKRHPLMNLHTRLMDGHLYLMKRRVLDLLAEESSISTIKGELMPYLVRKQFSRKDNSSGEMSKKESGGSDEEDYTKLALKMSVWNGNESGCVRHSDRDSDSDSDVRCHAYVMDGGLCLRTNTLVTYCEANRQAGQLIDHKQVHSTANVHQKSQLSQCLSSNVSASVAQLVPL
ncbi:hypothetical protein NP493_9098g00001 [Ridgeia piscesae]|uniref:Translation initiation factor eIF2B subunit gamma n=1 Tax=Ridgeia piscesae TaxID=27915 RepID=A0AAD9IM72_RIDPI|nr:hypothetical protein NP493_9098g00001 [Ridgeia piscesae]